MTRLPDTEPRCAGRMGLQQHAPACPRRHACLRHTTLLRESPNPIPARVPVATGLCVDGADRYLPEAHNA